ncbi:hypothetical protein PMI16_02831 [Herbaspirillum sp. CF444]|nr:hypothetical protein PMI16_02831 [Herbaspirillum sp. CF444]
METPETSATPATPATPDAWAERANELMTQIEVLLEAQLVEYELLNSKLEEWKQNPGAEWLTMADYEPWQNALKALEVAQREFDAHISTRVE